jgi:hypothetical protein
MIAGLAAGALLAAVWTAAPAAAAETVCTFSDERLTEISGMTRSMTHPGVLWVHNDSSGGPYLYAVDEETCDTLARITLRGADARDFEGIASSKRRDGRGMLWLGDIGDNRDSWPTVSILRVREPEELKDQEVPAKAFTFTYPDGPHNAETVLAAPVGVRLWVVTKQLARGKLYKLPKPLAQLETAKPLQDEGALITDGAVSPDGSRYVLRDYVNAVIYDGLPPGDEILRVELPQQAQGEAITWTADSSALLVASERDDRLLRVPLVEGPSAAASPSAQPSSTPSPAPSASTPIAAPEASGQGAPLWSWVVALVLVLAALGLVGVIEWRRRA